ncbi:MAG: transcription-repair coupling factor [Candidatus Omnitrophota bacterium]
MFKSLKLYTGETLNLEHFLQSLVSFGYKRQESTAEEGDFSRRGEVIDVFPATFELPIRIHLDLDKISSIKTFKPNEGIALWQHEMVIILPIKKAHPIKTIAFKEDFPLDNFVDINIGDYVVHTRHGIGKFLGYEKIKKGDKRIDHLVVEYDRSEKLYVPVSDMNLVQKYIAFQVRKPKLNRLGTKEWNRIKERAKKGIQKLAWDLISLQAMRLSIGGHKFPADSSWQAQFEKTFPFQETPDQITAMQEVKHDMESAKPMDRLLCGDVGYGKTEVAMRAAFKAITGNKQVAFLVPTTILAEQHYRNFINRLSDFPIKVELLSRFKTRSEQKEAVKGIIEGTVDMVVGTHRLLSSDIGFKDLGLVIIDEEQRFGVKAKEKLKTLRLNCDVLTLTATPIPRTLYMSLMGAKDLSVINTAPENRLPINTIVVEYDEDLIRQAIVKEVTRKGQVYFLHNRIEDIEAVKEKLQSILPGHTRIAIGHGQMPAKILKNIMRDFFDGRIDVLLCTMIIQSGIDIPNVNTVIVNNAQDFGLSDMHQLRGRVGRSNRCAYAYFLIPKQRVIDNDAKRRLQAIQEHWHLGSGFKIATEDLQIRGAGNLLGTQQHGFIQAVGFDLYCRLLKEAIGSMQKAMTGISTQN